MEETKGGVRRVRPAYEVKGKVEGKKNDERADLSVSVSRCYSLSASFRPSIRLMIDRPISDFG